MPDDSCLGSSVAIIGVSGRFPGAANLDAFWDNIVHGVDSISHFQDNELEPSRLEQPGIRHLPNYVKARGILDGIDSFDSGFFSFTPREAAVMDPQHRLFLQTAWEALECAGYDPKDFDGSIGVWGGMSNATYYLENILTRPDILAQFGPFQAMLMNEKDYLATRVSYKLHLRGPSISVHTACSSSLVAVSQAYQALITYQCDMALAGGVSVTIPQRRGHLYQEGAIGSIDGKCRPFDSKAAGTLFSDGVGIVLLKRLEEALTDGDEIWAVLRGAAVNNDGGKKVSFTAPSVDGQAEVILMAQELAGVTPESVSYVEGHGTATPMGDPIEVAALTQAFRQRTNAQQFCVLGSVKGNIGHLDAAAGIAGLLKTVLALRHHTLPPTAHFTEPNPTIDFESGPFFVIAEARPWQQTPRIAGVSSFGIGGTNAHVIVEEAPPFTNQPVKRKEQVLVLSAKTPTALNAARLRLAQFLRVHPDASLADVAFTLQLGRRAFEHRLAVTCSNAEEAIASLEGGISPRISAGRRGKNDAKVAFMFPGQGSQRVGVAESLYRTEPVFAAEFDACVRAFEPLLGTDIRSLAFAEVSNRSNAERQLSETAFTQPVMFSLELALARLWMSWGIEPTEMIGHSLGEYVAACLADVFSREDAALVVTNRGRLMQSQPRGSMMAVHLSVDELKPWLATDVVAAALNAPGLTVVSGPTDALKALEVRLAAKQVVCKVLVTSHAFHSPMMDGAIEPFRNVLSSVSLRSPRRTWISCVTGKPITSAQATDPEYWVRQLREPVRFSAGIWQLGQDPDLVFLEVGPGHALSTLVQLHADRSNYQKPVVTTLGRETDSELLHMLDAVGLLWSAGVPVNWSAMHSGEQRRRVALPTYPFEGQRCWVDAASIDQRIDSVTIGRNEQTNCSNSNVKTVDEKSTSGSLGTPANAEATVSERVRQLISNAIGVPPNSVNESDSLLEAGFDSLLLTQFAAALQKEFGLKVSLRDLLEEYATPSTLITHIEKRVLTPIATEVPNERTSTTSGDEAPMRDTSPVPGARKGRDANGAIAWFVPDPERPGKYLQVSTVK